ncbi:MAG: hypothetical protein WC701_11015 [Kiritimatiellales bacterium]|jgi:hypothetical protein
MSEDHLMRSAFSTLGILVLLLLAGCGEHTQKQDASRKTEARFRDYKVIISESDENELRGGYLSRVEIFKGKALVYAMDSHRFDFGNRFNDEKKENATPIGMDITGDGQPNLVIAEYTGGAHCCLLFHIFEIGNTFRHIQTLDLEDSDSDFKNLDNDPALELPTEDWTFEYWHTCFADSPAPEVILKYSAGQYRMAPNLMKKLPRHQAELYETAAKIRSMPQWKDPEAIERGHQSGLWKVPDPNYPKVVPSDLWREMLTLIYTGNMYQAWKLLDLAWPEGIAGKQEFLEEFKAQLKMSLFWEQLQDMNKNLSVKEP